jgi:hypothetical protein
MSTTLRAILNSMAQEEQRIRQQSDAIAAMASLAQASLMPLYGNPALPNGDPRPGTVVQATNEVLDPQGLQGVGSSSWSVTGGALLPIDIAPEGWIRTMALVAAGGAIGTITAHAGAALAAAGPAWAYALVSSDVAGTIRLKGVTSGTSYETRSVIAGAGWTLYVFSTPAAVAEGLEIVLASSANMTAGQRLRMTGVTVCYDADPGEPFSGDSLAENAYAWQGPRSASRSIRYGTEIDIVAMLEQQAQLDVKPSGQSPLQRRAYMLQRFKARHRPYGSTFIELIAGFIQFDNPSFTTAGVRVVENFAEYSFSLEIDYSPTALLGERVARLVAEIQPCHLAHTATAFGNFILSPATGAGQLDVTTL